MTSNLGWPIATLLITVALLLGEWSGQLPDGWWFLPWVLSLLVFGLPHGALDHEVMLRLWKPRPPPSWALVAILAAYLALSLFVFAGWFWFPQLIFIGFILLTWAHWGLADLWWTWRRNPDCFASRTERVVFAIWRGALPMLVPLLSDPSFYRLTAESTCKLFQSEASDFGWLESEWMRGSTMALLLILFSITLYHFRRQPRLLFLEILESGSLLLLFGFLPALASVGLYFAFWHGLRHILRLLESEKLAWKAFLLRSLPATVGALLLMLFWSWMTPPQKGAWDFLGLYLALIASLTVPHALLVLRMDWEEGLWKRSFIQ